jgi:hypothetical protein
MLLRVAARRRVWTAARERVAVLRRARRTKERKMSIWGLLGMGWSASPAVQAAMAIGGAALGVGGYLLWQRIDRRRGRGPDSNRAGGGQ